MCNTGATLVCAGALRWGSEDWELEKGRSVSSLPLPRPGALDTATKAKEREGWGGKQARGGVVSHHNGKILPSLRE